MNVDVQIYVSNLKKFFNENPDDLANLIPLEMKEIFYDKVLELANQNSEEGKEIPLSRKQLIKLCVDLNGNPPKKGNEIFIETEFGNFFLNWKKSLAEKFFWFIFEV